MKINVRHVLESKQNKERGKILPSTYTYIYTFNQKKRENKVEKMAMRSIAYLSENYILRNGSKTDKINYKWCHFSIYRSIE